MLHTCMAGDHNVVSLVHAASRLWDIQLIQVMIYGLIEHGDGVNELLHGCRVLLDLLEYHLLTAATTLPLLLQLGNIPKTYGQ
jgi:hypothetical protein